MKSSGKSLRDLGEAGLLSRLQRFAAPAGSRLIVSFGDDTAVWDPDPRGRRLPYLLYTADTLVEGTHFRRDWIRLRDLGRKLIASNVSDLAAMGGRAGPALISLACPPETPLAEIEEIYRGISEECRRWGAPLAGGDSVRSDRLVLTAALLGEKERSSAPALRDGVRPGQRIYVTGWPGESGAGLWMLRAGMAGMAGAASASRGARREIIEKRLPAWKNALLARHRTPTPRLEAGQALARAFPDLAMIDVSDGLDHELHILARASKVKIRVPLSSIPISPALVQLEKENARFNALKSILYGGEDYELLFATRSRYEEVMGVVQDAIRGAAQDSLQIAPHGPARGAANSSGKRARGLMVHEIGEAVEKSTRGAVVYCDDSGRRTQPPDGAAYEHYE